MPQTKPMPWSILTFFLYAILLKTLISFYKNETQQMQNKKMKFNENKMKW